MPLTNTQLLRALRETLQSKVLPTASDEVKRILSRADLALMELLKREAVNGTRDAKGDAAGQALLATGRTLLAQSGSRRRSGQDPETLGALVELVKDIGASLATVSVSEAWRSAALKWLSDVSRYEESLVLEKAHELLSTENPDAHVSAPIDRSRLAEYLAERLNLDAVPRIDSIDEASGGFSRQTLIVRYAASDGAEQELVLRRELPWGLLDEAGHPLAREFPFHRYAFRSGFPVPEPLWFEPDTSIIDGPFIAMRRVAGAVLGSAMVEYRPVTAAHLREIAIVLARLHSMDWEPHATELTQTFGAAASERHDVARTTKALLDTWEGHYRKYATVPSPTVVMLFDWLRRNVPQSSLRPAIVHGDAGIYNILFEGERITALLDWELVRLGDPAHDLGHIRNFVMRHMDWQTFKGWYREHGGPDIDEAAIRYFGVLHQLLGILVNGVAPYMKAESGAQLLIRFQQEIIGRNSYFRDLSSYSSTLFEVSS